MVFSLLQVFIESSEDITSFISAPHYNGLEEPVCLNLTGFRVKK